MKSQTLRVKRRPASKGIFRRLRAVTRHRAAAAAIAEDMENADGSSRISRALIIIFLIHIVAIGMIFIHQRFLDARPAAHTETVKAVTKEAVATVPTAAPSVDSTRQASGEKPYIVKAGDNYTRIATAAGVDEGNLRLINKHVDIAPGVILKIPPPRGTATNPPAVTASRGQTPSDHIRAFVPVEANPVNVGGAPKAHPAKPATVRETTPATTASNKTATGKSYVVKAGDTIWHIANQYKVGEDALMRANNMRDARKLRTGMKLTIPQK